MNHRLSEPTTSEKIWIDYLAHDELPMTVLSGLFSFKVNFIWLITVGNDARDKLQWG